MLPMILLVLMLQLYRSYGSFENTPICHSCNHLVHVGGINRRVLNRALYTNYIALPIPLWWPSKSWISVDILDKPGHNLHKRLNFIVSVRFELVLRHQTDTTAIQPKKESIAAQEGINSSIHQSWPRPALVPTAGEHDGYHIAMVTPC